jgi:hypothetical protein
MARTSTGAITIYDVTDGTTPITAFLSNENHSFVASQAGVVSSTDAALFSTTATVFLGDTRLLFAASATSGTASYKFGDLVITDNDTGSAWSTLVATTVANQRQLNISTTGTPIPATADNTQAIVAVPVIITTASGSETTIDLSLTLTKAVQGAGGLVINFNYGNQFFKVDENDLESPTDQSDITVGIDTTGSVGTLALQSSVNGGAFSTVATDVTNSVSAGTVKSQNLTDGGSFVIAIENFFGTNSGVLLSTSNTVSYRLAGSVGGVDVVTIAKVQKGTTGAAAVHVVIESSNGVTFKTNDTASTKTLKAKIYDSATGLEIIPKNNTSPGSSDLKYSWTVQDNTGSSSTVRTTSDATRTVIASGGVEQFNKTINASGSSEFDKIIIDDNDVSTSAQYTCEIETSD